MTRRKINWTEAEILWCRGQAERPRRELWEAFCDTFDRDVRFDTFKGMLKRNGIYTGRTGRFERGQISHNKGRKGYCPPGSEKGWFRKGERQGRAAALHQPIGAERISKDGYRERKINDDLPFQRRWRAVHLIEWEAANGPIPAGHALKCLDGDKLNTDPANWLSIPRAMLPDLAGARRGHNYDRLPPEAQPAALATARLRHAVREAERRAAHDRSR